MSETKPQKKSNVSELEERIGELEQKLEDALETEQDNNFTESERDDTPLSKYIIRPPNLHDVEQKLTKTTVLLTKFLSLVHPEISSKLEEALQLDCALNSPDIPFGGHVRDILDEKKRLLQQEIRDMASHLQKKPKKQAADKL